MSSISQTYEFILPVSQHKNIDFILDSKPAIIKKKFNLDQNYFYTVKNYLKKVKRNNYTFYDKYSNSKCGRMFGLNSTIQSLSNELRGFIFGSSVYDIDIKNASFNCIKFILTSYFPDKKDNFKTILDYCYNRDKYFKNDFDKQKFISVLFSAEPKTYIKNYLDDTTKELIKEISNFHELLKDNLHLFSNIEFKDSHFGSKVSYIIFNMEDRILKDILKDYKKIVVAPVFDGILINSNYNLENSLKDINEITKKYDIQLINKPLPKINFEDTPPEYNNEYLNMKKKYEENHFMVEDPVQYVRMYENDEGIQTTYYSKKDFIDLVNTYQIDNKPFFNEWLKDEDRRSYKKCYWFPNLEKGDPQNFNTFTGFKSKKIENINMEKVSKFLDHLKLLTNYEEIATDYLIKYISHMFQKPEELPQTALLFKSYEGVGKDIFTDFLGKLLDTKLVHKEPKIENVVGTFNSSTKNKLVLQLDEVQGKDGHFNKEILKNLITSTHINIRKMRTDAEKFPNFIRLFLFTNNVNPIDIPADDRRYLVFQCGKPKDKEYYVALTKLLLDNDALNSIYTYFMNYDITNFTPHIDRVETQAYKNIQKHNTNPFYEFLIEVVNDPGTFKIFHKGDKSYMITKFIEHFYSKFLIENYPHINSNSKRNKAVLLDLGAFDKKFYVNKKQVRGFEINIPELKETLEKYHQIEKEEIIELEGEVADFLNEYDTEDEE